MKTHCYIPFLVLNFLLLFSNASVNGQASLDARKKTQLDEVLFRISEKEKEYEKVSSVFHKGVNSYNTIITIDAFQKARDEAEGRSPRPNDGGAERVWKIVQNQESKMKQLGIELAALRADYTSLTGLKASDNKGSVTLDQFFKEVRKGTESGRAKTAEIWGSVQSQINPVLQRKGYESIFDFLNPAKQTGKEREWREKVLLVDPDTDAAVGYDIAARHQSQIAFIAVGVDLDRIFSTTVARELSLSENNSGARLGPLTARERIVGNVENIIWFQHIAPGVKAEVKRNSK